MNGVATQEAFSHYASAQTAYGLHLLCAHRRDDNDCCRQCGQGHPCAQRRRGAELIIHFGQWNSPRFYSVSVTRHPRTAMPGKRRLSQVRKSRISGTSRANMEVQK